MTTPLTLSSGACADEACRDGVAKSTVDHELAALEQQRTRLVQEDGPPNAWRGLAEKV